jgi:hypothetical protein
LPPEYLGLQAATQAGFIYIFVYRGDSLRQFHICLQCVLGSSCYYFLSSLSPPKEISFRYISPHPFHFNKIMTTNKNKQKGPTGMFAEGRHRTTGGGASVFTSLKALLAAHLVP